MSGAEADVSSDGDSSFEDDEVPLPPSPLKEGTSEPFQVVLKGGSPWGFNLKGIKGTRTPVQISEIVPDSKADGNGQLQVGDYILMVNDVKCTSATEAVQLIESAFRTLTLQVWRGTTEPLTSPVRSASILQKVRESTRHQAATQDDSVLLTESKNRMKPRQRRIESFHGRRGSAHTSGTSASTSKLNRGTESQYTSSPGQSSHSDDATKGPLKEWATEHDLSTPRQPVIMSANATKVPSSRYMPLSASKSSPSLNNEELVNAVTTPRSYSSKPTTMLAIAKSTPDIPDQMNYENVTSPTSPKSPTWYQQKFPNRNMFEFPSSSIRRNAGSPRNSYTGGSPRNSYASGSPRNSYAGYSSSYNPSSYPQSAYPGFSPTSVPSSIAFPQTSLLDTSSQRGSGSYAQSQRLTSANSYDDSSNQIPSKNYDRRSLPPQMLYQYRQDYLKESNKPEPQKHLTSMPVTKEEEEAERELASKQFHHNGVDSGAQYTPPAPPVRDISSLKYVTMSRNHEKFPSWPVTTANPPQNLGPPVEAHPVEAQMTDKVGDKDSDREKSDKSSSSGSKSSDKTSSVTLERKGSDEAKQPRNQSDPGFKKTKKSFYTSRKPKLDGEPNYENLKSEEERFDEFCKHSKPGYPPPRFDPDGHNFGDEKYSIPSPPERDTPHLDQKSLVEKIAAVISPTSHNSYQQYSVSVDTNVSKSNKVDTATSPPKMPGFYFKKALSQSQSSAKTMVDSSTSPLSSPKSDSSNLKTISASSTSDSYLSPTDKSRGLIIRQKPYYNTSTQTDGVFNPESQSKNERISDSGDQSNVSKLSSTSSVNADAESQVNMRSDASSVTSGIGSMTISDHSSAPMLRKLSEEFFRGKLTGNIQGEKRLSSSTFEEGKGNYEALYGNLKEAESYSSVVIHPHETSAPFGSDELGPGSLPREITDTVFDHHAKYKSRHSLDPSTILHKPSGSYSMPPRSLQESRFTSESNLSSTPTSRTHSQSLLQLDKPPSSLSSQVDIHKNTPSESSSSSSRPYGSMEARSSGGSRLSSDSSVTGRPNSRRDSDNVFYENKSSPITKENPENAPSATLGRKESMQMAYGTFDENERHYATPYGHQRNSSEVISSSSPDQTALHARSFSHTDYMPMSYNLNDANRLGQIQEEGSEIRWQEAVLKSRSLSRDNKIGNYANFSLQTREQKSSLKGSDSESSNSEKKKDTKTNMRRTVSEQIRPVRQEKKQTRNSEAKDYSSSGESSKGNKSDGESLPRSGSSDSDLKRQQQKAVMDFFERKNKMPDVSEPLSPRSETAPIEFPPPPPPENKPPKSPTPTVQTPQSPLSDLTKRYNYTKAQRTESLRRTRSSISSTSSRESDYMEMNRLHRASHYQTEWSRLRSQEGGIPKRPQSTGSDISAGEHFPVSSSPQTISDADSSLQRSTSETIPKQLEAEQDRVVESPSQDDGPHQNNNDTMVTSPIYHNFPGGDYPRRPPPPVPGSGSDEKPPALPPRSYHRPFTHSRSESMLRVDSNIVDDGGSKSQKWEQSANGTLREDAYAQQLRRQARRFSEHQHKPISMQVVSTKSSVHVSLTQSFKQEPNQAMEAVPVQKLSSSTSPNSDKTQSMHHSPPLRSETSPEPVGLPPLPTPLKNGETEIIMDTTTPVDFPPPPPEFMEGADQITDKEKRYADDSYASYKSKAAQREVGKYKRAISDSNVLRVQQETKLRSPDLNNISETPNKPPRKKLELGRISPDFGQHSNSPSMTGGESHMPSLQVPSFKAAETSSVPLVQKSVAKPLQSANAQKLNSPASSGSSGSFVSTVVQRPSQGGVSVPEEQRPSVKDRVKSIEVYSHSPVLSKAPQKRDSPLTERKTVFQSDNNKTGEQGTSQQMVDSLEKLESSVKSSDSFRDRLRPVVRKVESERIEEPSHVSSRRSHERKSNDNVDRVTGLPPEVPSRTYKDPSYTGEQRSNRELPNRSNSFQSRHPAVHHPRPYDKNKTTGSGYSPVDMNNYKNRSGKEPQRSPSQSVPEPQVPRQNNQPYSQRQSHDIPDKFSDKPKVDQKSNIPSPEHRVRHPSYSDKTENSPGQTQNSVLVGQKRKMDNSFVNHGKSHVVTVQSNTDTNTYMPDKNMHDTFTPSSRSNPNTQSDISRGDNKLTPDKQGDDSSDKTRSSQIEKSPAHVTSYHRGDFKNWKNDLSSYKPSNVSIQDSKSASIQSSDSNLQRDLNKVSESVQNKDVHSVEILHNRQPSAEELECDLKAHELAQVLKESDRELSSVLATDSHKVRMRYMDGILPVEGSNEDVKPRPRSQSELKEDKKEEQKEEPTSPMPSEYYVSPPKAMIELEIRKFGDKLTQDIGDNDALAQKKEELLQRMIRKVDILKEDRKELISDIDANESLGKQVMTLVEQKCCSQQEKEKYKSYIEDVDKIIKLLLKLSGLLARAENTIQGLTEGTNEKIRKMTYDKRDRLHKQHEDAKELKLDIDRRREQVETFLKDAFTDSEMDDYNYYIKMKSKYIIQMQELEDKITLGNEQIGALQKSIPTKS